MLRKFYGKNCTIEVFELKMTDIINFLNVADIKKSEAMLSSMENRKLQEVYCECVNIKKTHKLAYDRLSNELNKRKDKQIQKKELKLEEELF